MTFVHEVVNSGKSKNKNQNQDAIHFKNGLYREEYTAPYSLYGPNGVYSSTKEENCFFWWRRTENFKKISTMKDQNQETMHFKSATYRVHFE